MAFSPLDLRWALTTSFPPLDFVLPGLLPGTLGTLIAPGGTGKSQFMLDTSISLALGRSVADGLFPAKTPAKVVYLAGEESGRLLAERLRSHLTDRERNDPSLYENLILLPMAGETCELITGGRPTALHTELGALAKGARLIVIDPLRRMHDGDENSSSDMTRVVIAMEQLATVTGAAVIGLHHANRASSADASSQNSARGSSALVDGARWQVNLSRMDGKTADRYGITEAERTLYVALDFAKANYLAAQPRIWLKRGSGGRLTLAQLSTAQPTAKSRNSTAGAYLLPTH